MESRVVSYRVDDETVVGFEIEPMDGFVPAGIGEIAGQVRKAVEPAITAAQAVLDQVKTLAPEGVEVKFGVKVTGTANWLIAKAATEGSFEVTLTWHPRSGHADKEPEDLDDGQRSGSL